MHVHHFLENLSASRMARRRTAPLRYSTRSGRYHHFPMLRLPQTDEKELSRKDKERKA
ncbi:hypothetical protein K458DRAFT_416115 [Lentithecium fluviatile CBS 122367]|uniref:Uncharacterized protein n=1 Tax=Lentithecium fluviatile CBS 122367 TaxID=1168545 RepID=A0A6G1J8C5_9PLEO|nr:hypothetical protein K458DRAFT_416115 [Lentithecium fluviatile CBS 122367]